MIGIDLQNRKPIYEQIVECFVTVLRLSLMSLKKCRPASAVLREMPGAKSEYFIGV